jgi:hypothetical protein
VATAQRAADMIHPLGAGKTNALAQARAVRQSIFSVIVKIDPARAGELTQRLDALQAALAQRGGRPFENVETLHFCSFTIFDDDRFGPYLVFENNIDGSPNDYLDAICAAAAPELHEIFRCGRDFDAGAADGAYLAGYLRRHIVRADAAFVGNVGRSARRIVAEASLVAQIHDFLDCFEAPAGMTPEAIVADVRDFVRSDDRWSWVWQPPPRLAAWDRATRWAAAAAAVAALLMVLVFGWFVVLLYVIALRRLETTDPVDIPGPPLDHVQRLTAREDQVVQNHMASLCYVKPGTFRQRTLKVVLRAANLVARVSTNGSLTGLDTLHFAHWSLIDDDTRLLFLTNYDGSWENYLDDFIDKVAIGLTAIWSNTRNFPRTAFLVTGGARDERNFKAIARTTQANSSVWYSAYSALTVTGIERNTAVCEGLAQPASALDARAWLLRF